MNLFLFEKTELYPAQNNLWELSPPEYVQVSLFLSRRDVRADHLLKVLRKKTGDSFDAGILGGKLGTGIIREISAGGLYVDCTLDTEPPPRTPLRLGVGFPRPIQLRRLLRDCASLGLAAIDLIGTELGEKSYRDTKLLDDGGARSALIEGAVQARDTRLPELAVSSSLALWLESPAVRESKRTDAVLFAADNVRPGGNFSGLPPIRPGTSAVLAIGSERGWSGREREQLDNAGFRRLSMGKRVLRTETACTAASILLMEKLGCIN